MRKVILSLIVLITCFCGSVAGQKKDHEQYFLFSLEPNITLGNRTFDHKAAQTYVKNKNVLGIGLNIGYQLEWDHLFTNARLFFLASRNAIDIDFASAGFNDSSAMKYSNGSYSFEYNSSVGLALNGGYKLHVSKSNSIYLGAGFQAAYALKQPKSNAVEVYTGNGTGNNMRNVYYELITHAPSLVAGANLFVNYDFYIGSAHLLTGVNYYFVPGQQIKGSYVAFSGMPSENSGTMEIRRSYLCVSLGIMTGRK